MKALIFAAGLGTRLKPLTDRMPKALVPVDGRPLLRILIERLAEAGIREMVVNVHHFADQIEDYLKVNGNFGLDIRLSDERAQLLETGGGLRHALPLLGNSDGEPVLIHNVDILSNMDIPSFCRCGKEADVVLLVSERETQRYLLFDEAMRLVGWTNVATGEVRSPYPDLDVTRCQRYAFAGMHLFSPRLFPMLEAWPERFGIMDFYLQVCDRVVIRGHVQTDLRLLDVGKQDTLLAAEEFVKTL